MLALAKHDLAVKGMESIRSTTTSDLVVIAVHATAIGVDAPAPASLIQQALLAATPRLPGASTRRWCRRSNLTHPRSTSSRTPTRCRDSRSSRTRLTTAAAIDRVVHHSVILEMNGPSVRGEVAAQTEEGLVQFGGSGVLRREGVVERLHVRAAMTRKNFRFAGRHAGGERAAIAYTVLGCALAGSTSTSLACCPGSRGASALPKCPRSGRDADAPCSLTDSRGRVSKRDRADGHY